MNKIICPNCNKNVEKSEKCELCDSGLILNERYYLLKKIGQNIGVTYKAFDEKTKKNVVIKELSIKKLKTWKDEELFKREADTLMSINHSQIPKLIDYFELRVGKKVKYYTVMEFLEGDTLKIVADTAYFSEEKIISLIKEISVILNYLHDLTPRVVHRDIKPSNIIKRKDGKYSLIDFDSVTNVLKPNSNATIAGTFGYMAPEQFMGKSSYKSDYYSLGVIALELLTKKNASEFMKGVKLDWSNVKLSKKMQNILSALLDENPDTRIGSFKELDDILREQTKVKELKKVETLVPIEEYDYIMDENASIKLSLTEKLEVIDIYEKLYKKLKENSIIYKRKAKPLLFNFVVFIALTPLFAANPLYLLFFFAYIFWNSTSYIRKQDESKKALEKIFPKLNEKELSILSIILDRNRKNHYIKKHYFNFLCEEKIKNRELDRELLDKYRALYSNNNEIHKSLKDRYL